MGNLQGFDVNAEYEDEFTPIPPGEYSVVITDLTIAPKEETGSVMLKGSAQVTSGEYQNRYVRISHPLHNKRKDQGQKIGPANNSGQRFLQELLFATGKQGAADTMEVCGCRVLAKVIIEPERGDYSAQNNVKSVKSAKSAPPTTKPQDSETTVVPEGAVDPAGAWG